MKVLLYADIDKLGWLGDVVEVKDGYARNYLVPHGLAYPATPANKRRVEAEASSRVLQSAAEQSDAEVLAAKLENIELTFTAKVGEADKLFGSVTSADIADKLGELGYPLDKRAVELEEPIKMIGIYKIPVRLHPEVHAKVRVWVVKE